MEAIILAGGFGTRLRHTVSNVPKPMAPVNGKPFLQYIFDYLLDNGIRSVILAVGYKAEIIQQYFGTSYKGIKITYSMENVPLGTGGAIKKALKYCYNKDVFIINGDTYFDVDLKQMKKFHENENSKLTLAIKSMKNFDRYGSVNIVDNMVRTFEEKKPIVQGKINGGTYLLNRRIMDCIDQQSFSFEKIVLESKNTHIYAFESKGYFIDIGVPEDYYKANKDFVSRWKII